MNRTKTSQKLLAGTLAAGFLSLCSLPSPAQERFGNSLIRFAEDTVVEFEVQFTQGANRSEFGVIVDPGPVLSEIRDPTEFDNLKAQGKLVPLFIETRAFDARATSSDARAYNDPNFRVGDFLGTVNAGTIIDATRQGAIAVPGVQFVQANPQAANGRGTMTVAYTFKANRTYALYLGTYTSTNDVFIRTLESRDSEAAGLQGGLDSPRGNDRGEAIFWEDQGEGVFDPQGFISLEPTDDDFNDFVIVAGGVLVTPPCVKLPSNIR